MNWKELLFGKKKPPVITDIAHYPIKSAPNYGNTFNEWRTRNGYNLKKGSVPDSSLSSYCSDCGWPSKSDWQNINNLPSGYLDTYQYSIWLKFIGVIDGDRHPNEASKFGEYIKSLKK